MNIPSSNQPEIIVTNCQKYFGVRHGYKNLHFYT